MAKPRKRQLHQSGTGSAGTSARPQPGAGPSAGSQRWLVELAARMGAVVTLTPAAPPVGSFEAAEAVEPDPHLWAGPSPAVYGVVSTRCTESLGDADTGGSGESGTKSSSRNYG